MSATPETEPRKKIAIVGFTTTRLFAPFDDPDWEVWGMNNLHLQPDVDESKFDRWYDLHPKDLVVSDQKHTDWLAKTSLPVYMWDEHPEFPSSKVFPRHDVESQFGHYFTNSVSWMMAHALQELQQRCQEPTETAIGIWGIDMATDSEYGSQRPSCEWMIGVAQGMGVQVVIPEQSDLLKSSVQYGVDHSPLRAKLAHRAEEMKNTKNQLEQQRGQLQAQLNQVDAHINQMVGAIESNQYILNVWTMPEVKRNDPMLPTPVEDS